MIDAICWQYSEAQLKLFIEAYFETYFREYKSLVEMCFPLLKEKMLFYSRFPIGVYVEVFTDGEHNYRAIYGYKFNALKQDIIVDFNPSMSRFGSNNINWNEISEVHPTGLEEFFGSDDVIPLYYSKWGNRSWEDGGRWCLLRNRIYSTIEQDLREIDLSDLVVTEIPNR